MGFGGTLTASSKLFRSHDKLGALVIEDLAIRRVGEEAMFVLTNPL